MSSVYGRALGCVERHVSPKRAHDLAASVVGPMGRVAPARRAVRRVVAPGGDALAVSALGLRFASPLCVAAGLDKNGTWLDGLGALGFGAVEVGTITARPQAGNPVPNIERLYAHRALLNWMGFPNEGAAAIAPRLARASGETVLGVNIGKLKASSLAEAVDEHRTMVRLLAPPAGYLVLNVSSPNTPGLRDMQASDVLRELVGAVLSELDALGLRVPVLVKIAPDLDDAGIDAVADLALELGLAGLIATNTTIDRAAYPSALRAPGEPAGLSGAPLTARSEAVLRRLRARVGDRIVLVAAGGVMTPEHVLDRVLAGATLVQGYTGFVYGGPLWPRAVNRFLAAEVRARGVGSVGELVGAGVPD